MEILIVTDNLRDQINGVATTFKHIAIQAENDGYKVRFLDPSNFNSFSCPFYKEIKLAIPFGIPRKIQRPDFIHIATEGPIGLATKLYCDKHSIPYSTSYHTNFPEYLKDYIPTSITYSYLRWFHKNSTRVLATTKSMKNLLESKGFSNIVEWTRGVDTKVLKDLKRNPTNTVLYVGRVSKEKNLEELLKLDYNIVIVGDGPERNYLQSKYKANFVGYKTGKDLFQYYLDADVFCFPSKSDTFGIVIIEALAAGTPVAAYPVTGPIDIITNGVDGYLEHDLKEAIDKCLKLGRVTSRDWSWSNCWNIFKNELRKIEWT